MEFTNNSSLIQSFVNVAPFINSLTNSDFSVSICDLEKCICYIPGKKINHGLKSGDKHIEGSGVHEAIRTKKRILKRIEKGIFPFSYIAIAIPLFEGEKIVGAVSFCENTEKQDRLFEMANILYHGIEETSHKVTMVNEEVKIVYETGKKLSDDAKEAVFASNQTDEILKIVKGILNKTNILGINTAIEASRLGDQGKGFMVLSNEIRMMSSSIKESVKKTEDILVQIKEKIERIDKRIIHIHQACDLQAISMGQALSSLEEITNISRDINSLALEISQD